MKRRLLNVLLLLLPAGLFLLAWELTVMGDARLRFLFASPLMVAQVGAEELAAGYIYSDIYATSLEALLGLIVGSSLGTLVGLLLWINSKVAAISKHYVILLGSIPIFAIAPMLIIWFGTGLLSKVVMSAFSVFFVALSQAYDGARFCSKEQSNFAETLNANRLRVLRFIIVPGALRWVIAGLKMSVGLALVGAFIGEFVSSQVGLGHYILKSGSLYDMPRVLFGVALLSALALFASWLVSCIERWKPHLFAR